MVCNATLTMNTSITLMKLAKASVARTMFGCPCSCSAVADVVQAIAQPLRYLDNDAAQTAGSGALVDRLGIGQKPALADAKPQLAGVDQVSDPHHRPATRRPCPGCGRAES
jgi:hypothetical protein